MTSTTTSIAVPHRGRGTHTLVVAVEIDDTRLADPSLDGDLVAHIAELIRPVLAERRGANDALQLLDDRQVTLAELRAYDRDPHVTATRQDVAQLLRQAGWTLPDIGRLLHRDHTTVLAMLRRQAERAPTPSATCEDCDQPSMPGGGRWCLTCFQRQAARRGRAKPPTRLTAIRPKATA